LKAKSHFILFSLQKYEAQVPRGTVASPTK